MGIDHSNPYIHSTTVLCDTLLGEITISSTRTTRVYYTSIPQYVMIYFHMQRFKFIDFMVIEVRFFKEKKKKKKKMKNMDKMWKSFFQILCFSHALYPDIIKSEINLKLKVKMKNILIYGFQWG